MKLFQSLNNNSKGIVCLVGALLFLTVSDSIIKWLSPRYALHEIMLFRAVFAMVMVLIFVQLEGGLHHLKTRRPALHLLRGSLLVLANMLFFLGLATMSLAETVSLFFSAPLFICMMSQPVLGEKVGGQRWAAIVLGFCGVIIMLRPGTDIFTYTALLPVLAALSYAGTQMVTRKLGMQEKAGTLTFYIQIAFLLICIVIGLTIGDGHLNNQSNPTLEFLLRAWTWPTQSDLLLLLICGVIVSFGGYLLSQAYRLAEAPVVAPFEYASMPIALLIGFFVWGDWPDWISFAGSGLIIFSGLMIVVFEKRESKRMLARIPNKTY